MRNGQVLNHKWAGQHYRIALWIEVIDHSNITVTVKHFFFVAWQARWFVRLVEPSGKLQLKTVWKRAGTLKKKSGRRLDWMEEPSASSQSIMGQFQPTDTTHSETVSVLGEWKTCCIYQLFRWDPVRDANLWLNTWELGNSLLKEANV